MGVAVIVMQANTQLLSKWTLRLVPSEMDLSYDVTQIMILKELIDLQSVMRLVTPGGQDDALAAHCMPFP